MTIVLVRNVNGEIVVAAFFGDGSGGERWW